VDTADDSADGSADDPGPAIGATGARFGGASRRRRRTRRKKAAEDDTAPVAESQPEADTAVIPVVPPSPVPRTGARLHGAPAEALAPVERAGEPPDADAPDGSEIGLTGARFGGNRRQRKPHPAPVEPAGAVSPVVPPPAAAPPLQEVEEPLAGGSASVRPYVFTRGRTRSAFELSIETLVSAAPQAQPMGLTGEHHAVLGLCREPRSVAELAARVGVPLGVARVLVGDLAAAGAVAVHRAPGADGPDLALMERVLSGLRKL
jgi:Protein of unknown function (DUF742)